MPTVQNYTPYNPWDAFEQGQRIGDNVLEGSNRRRLGEAYQGGGIEALETEAFGQGDVATGTQARRFRNAQEEQVYTLMERARPWVIPAIRRSVQMPPEEARAFLSQPHLRSRLSDIGLSDEVIERGIAGLTSANPEERQQWASRLESEFTAHQAPEWTLQTVPREGGGYERRPVAVDQSGDIQMGQGSLPVMPGEIQQLGSGGLWRQDPNSPQGYQVLREPREPASRATFGPEGLTNAQINIEDRLSQRWTPIYNNFAEIRDSFQRIQTASNQRNAAGDLALVVAFTKLLDPGSVAREGEVALTQSAASALAQAQNYLPRLTQGNTLLPPQVRQQLVQVAQEMFGNYQGAYQRLAQQTEQRATAYGADPGRVMMGYDGGGAGAGGGEAPPRPPNVPEDYIWDGDGWARPD